MDQPNILHANLIRAVLDGKTVQCRDIKFRACNPAMPGFEYVECIDATSNWMRAPRTPGNLAKAAIDLMVNNALDYEFRLKPESVVKWSAMYRGGDSGAILYGSDSRRGAMEDLAKAGVHGVLLRLELDPDTLEVISAKTEAP